MLLFIQLSLLVFYLTRMLQFVERDNHYGPFPSKTKFVTRPIDNYHQPVTLFDWIRRLTPYWNPYKVQGSVWTINEQKLEVWTCPFCLSFWTSFVATAILGIVVQPHFLELFTAHFAFASVSSILNYLVNYVQLRTNQIEEVDTSQFLPSPVSYVQYPSDGFVGESAAPKLDFNSRK